MCMRHMPMVDVRCIYKNMCISVRYMHQYDCEVCGHVRVLWNCKVYGYTHMYECSGCLHRCVSVHELGVGQEGRNHEIFEEGK